MVQMVQKAWQTHFLITHLEKINNKSTFHQVTIIYQMLLILLLVLQQLGLRVLRCSCTSLIIIQLSLCWYVCTRCYHFHHSDDTKRNGFLDCKEYYRSTFSWTSLVEWLWLKRRINLEVWKLWSIIQIKHSR